MKNTFEFLNKVVNEKGFFYKLIYGNQLRQLEKSYYQLDFSTDGIYGFQLDIEYIIFENTGDRISFTWNITELEAYIQENFPDEHKKMTIEDIRTRLGNEAFYKYINNVKEEPEVKNGTFQYSQKPIYIMLLNPSGQYYILDGKHRFYKAYCNNEELEVYELNSDALIPFLVNDGQRDVYHYACCLLEFIGKLK